MAQLLFIPDGSNTAGLAADYVPVLTPVVNVTSATLVSARYMRIGAIVSVMIEATVDPIGGGDCEIGASLPFPVAALPNTACAGLTVSVPGDARTVEADSVNLRAALFTRAQGGNPFDFHANFFYKIA